MHTGCGRSWEKAVRPPRTDHSCCPGPPASPVRMTREEGQPLSCSGTSPSSQGAAQPGRQALVRWELRGSRVGYLGGLAGVHLLSSWGSAPEGMIQWPRQQAHRPSLGLAECQGQSCTGGSARHRGESGRGARPHCEHRPGVMARC